MRDELKKSKAFEDPNNRFLDLGMMLAQNDGSLDPRLTDDGVHVNTIGAELIRNRISRLEF
jgi:hypothetical protein